MIVAERKPFEQIKNSLQGYKRILILGCGTCVSVCMAGGEKEVGLLASQLRMAFQLDGNEVEIGEATIQRQCDREYIEPLKETATNYDVILSMGCGAGVQFVSELLESKLVLPAVNTLFIGVTDEEEHWSERCQACGDCILADTGGVCPIARCAKHLLNGPCGGSQEGKCEVSPDLPCAWHLIIEHLTKVGQLKKLEEIRPPKNWQRRRTAGGTTKGSEE